MERTMFLCTGYHMHVGKILYVTLSMKIVCITKRNSLYYVILQKMQTFLVKKNFTIRPSLNFCCFQNP